MFIILLQTLLANQYQNLLQLYKHPTNSQILEQKTLQLGKDAVPLLTRILKDNSYPDENRWTAMFLLGRLMHKDASSFIVRFVAHDNPIIRMAALKTLLALQEDRYPQIYAQALKDKAMIIRLQALNNIRKLKITKCAPEVWNTIFSPDNYYINEHNRLKRTPLISRAIRTVGDLAYATITEDLQRMANNAHYQDIHSDIAYALQKIKAGSSNKK